MSNRTSRIKPLILVTDSEESVCGLMNELLRQRGYRVVSTTDPREVIAGVKEDAYDLIFIGLQMAKNAGLELARAVKERSPATSIVIMTGLDADDIMVELIDAGVDGVLLKPFDIDEALALASEFTQARHSALTKVS